MRLFLTVQPNSYETFRFPRNPLIQYVEKQNKNVSKYPALFINP